VVVIRLPLTWPHDISSSTIFTFLAFRFLELPAALFCRGPHKSLIVWFLLAVLVILLVGKTRLFLHPHVVGYSGRLTAASIVASIGLEALFAGQILLPLRAELILQVTDPLS